MARRVLTRLRKEELQMHTRNERDVVKIDLPGGSIRVLVGQDSLPAKFLTFGVTEAPAESQMTPHVP